MKISSSHQEQVERVSSFQDLVETAFHDIINAICWHRELKGDFAEIVSKLTLKEDITEVTIEDLMDLDLTIAGIEARDTIIHDLDSLTKFGAQPTLNLLKCYRRDTDLDIMATDVYSYHVDRSPLLIDTYICTYHGATSDIISNDQVEQKIKIPKIRSQLKELHKGPAEEFDQFLKEYFYDLHYEAKKDVVPTSLGNGHLWRLAVDHPDQCVAPCVHRAPLENDGQYRLMLIC